MEGVTICTFCCTSLVRKSDLTRQRQQPRRRSQPLALVRLRYGLQPGRPLLVPGTDELRVMPLQLRRAAQQPMLHHRAAGLVAPTSPRANAAVAGDHLLDELRQDPGERGAAGGALDVLERALPGTGEGQLRCGRGRQLGERGGGEHLEAREAPRGEDEIRPPREQLLPGRHDRDREADEEGVGGADDMVGARETRRDVPGGDDAPVVVLGDQPRLPAPVDKPHGRRGRPRRQVQARGQNVAHAGATRTMVKV
jgi:hypothetical protein